MTDTAEAPVAPAANTADTTIPSDACTANANDTMSNNMGTPDISKWEYGQQLHSLLTKQPIKKSLCGEELITHRQGLHAVMKARNLTIYNRDCPNFKEKKI